MLCVYHTLYIRLSISTVHLYTGTLSSVFCMTVYICTYNYIYIHALVITQTQTYFYFVFCIYTNRMDYNYNYMHFIDNTGLPLRDEPGFHRLQTVLPMITVMKDRFLMNYSPHPRNNIDEVMIPFKGKILDIKYT